MENRDNKNKKAVKIIEYTLYVITVILAIKFRLVFIDGYSMYPTYKDGEINIINTFDKEPEVGKVMIYKSSKGFSIVHRVKSIYGDRVIFRGDNNSFDDIEINKNRIIGTLIFQKDKEE